MSTRPPATVAPYLFGGALALACTPSFPEVTWQGEHLQVAKAAAGQVCEGSNPYQDRYVERLAELLQVELEEPIRFAYIEREDLETYCFQDEIWGCYYDDKAYAIFPLFTHELAHALADRAGWHAPPIFSEGFAESFAFNSDTGVERLPIREVIQNFFVSPDNYYTAGLFIRFIVQEYGLEQFGVFMRTSESDDDFGEIATTFEDVFGESLESALDAFDNDYPTCAALANQAAIVECGMDPLPWGPDGLDITVSLACDDDKTIGPFGQEMRSPRAIEIAEAGTFEIRVSSASGSTSGVRLTDCGDCREAFDEIVIAGTSRTVDLKAGRYFAIFATDVGEPADVTLRITKMP